MNLDDLEKEAARCELCSLHLGRQNPVFAKGNPESDIVICGMVPAKEENEAGLPFVGRSGQLLDTILHDVGLTLDDVYITNLVKCFLAAGRKLEQIWIQSCLPYLILQLNFIKPKVIVALGKDAAFTLAGIKDDSKPLGSIINKKLNINEGILIPTYHPSFLLRKGGKNNKYYDKVLDSFEIAKSIK